MFVEFPGMNPSPVVDFKRQHDFTEPKLVRIGSGPH